MLELDVETIENNWNKYESLLTRIEDKSLIKMLNTLGSRLCITPLSTRESDVGCYRGGLVEKSLQIASYMRKLNTVYDMNISTASIIKTGLLHDIGRIGDLEDDLLIDQDSSWHREKLGQFFKYNEDVEKMSVSHRTLWLLQHFGIALDRDEWVAIQLSQGSHFEENRFYVGSEPSLAIILQHARSIVLHKS